MFAETELKGVRVFTFSEFSQDPHFIFAVSSRQTDSDLGLGSQTSDLVKKAGLCDLLDIDSNRLLTLQQIHSARTVVVDHAMFAETGSVLGPADGIILTKTGLFAAVRTADCLPVVAVSLKTRQLLLVHMGWRGAKERILEKSLREFLCLTGAEPTDIVIALGPCIRRCCYEVGADVREAFKQAEFSSEQIFHGRHLDLVDTAFLQLSEYRVQDVLDSGLCTACRTDLFYSYRREATDSRMWTLAGFSR
jgi:YfiH family protein